MYDKALWNGVGFARTPGSREVLDRTTGKLVPCSSTTVCPMAVPVPPPANSTPDTPPLVNYAPGFGHGGFSGYINAKGEPAYKQAVYDFYSLVGSPAVTRKVLLHRITFSHYCLMCSEELFADM